MLPGACFRTVSGMEPAIDVKNLCMAYDATEVVHGIDLTVGSGEVFAVLGPNGAGKTTTIEILEGFRRRTGGEVRVLGVDPERAGASWRERIGVVLQSSSPEAELTAVETLRLYAGFYATPAPIDHLLELCGLQDQASMRNKRLSGGQQRRLDVALALVGNPELLFLDEPTTGFDPAARRGAWRMIEGLKSLGTTVVLTTHYLEEAEILADRIAIVVQGHVVAEGTPTELGGRDRAPTTITFRLAEGTPGPAGVERVAGLFRLETGDPTRVLHEISGWAIDRDVVLEDVDVRRPSLEDVYLELTKEPAIP